MKLLRYEQMTWMDIKKNLNDKILFIPIGSMEQHGPHLPIGVDSILAEKICENIGMSVGGIIAPVVSYGARSLPNSGGGLSYPGTIFLTGELLIRYYSELINSFVNSGAKRIFLINAHWENEPFIVEAVERSRENKKLIDIEVMVTSWWSVVSEEEMKEIFGGFPGWHAEHAGQAETALIYYFNPECVNMRKSVDCEDNIPLGIYKHPVPEKWKGNKGVLSKTKHVTKEMGEKLSNLVNEKLSCLIGKWENSNGM